MGLYINQNSPRTPLQEKLAKELQDKARQKAKTFDQPDGVTNSAYIEGTKTTSKLAWLWAIVIIGGIVAAIWVISASL